MSEFGFVDAPGYGYAKGDKRELQKWGKMMGIYISLIQSLQSILVLIDAEHGFKDSDQMLIEMLEAKAKDYIIVFTKADKVKKLDKLKDESAKIFSKYKKCSPFFHITSAT